MTWTGLSSYALYWILVTPISFSSAYRTIHVHFRGQTNFHNLVFRLTLLQLKKQRKGNVHRQLTPRAFSRLNGERLLVSVIFSNRPFFGDKVICFNWIRRILFQCSGQSSIFGDDSDEFVNLRILLVSIYAHFRRRKTWCRTISVHFRGQTKFHDLDFLFGVASAEESTKDGLYRQLTPGLTRRKWRWIGHVLRKESGDVAKEGLFWTPEGKRARGRPWTTWRRSAEKELKSLHLTWNGIRKAAQNRSRWRETVEALCVQWREKDRWWTPGLNLKDTMPLKTEVRYQLDIFGYTRLTYICYFFFDLKYR